MTRFTKVWSVMLSLFLMSSTLTLNAQVHEGADPIVPQERETFVARDGHLDITITVSVDYYSYEASWNLYNVADDSYYYETDQTFGGSYETNTEEVTLSDYGVYEIHCWDSWGDGGIGGEVTGADGLLVSWADDDYDDFGAFEFIMHPDGPANMMAYPDPDNTSESAAIELEWGADRATVESYDVYRSEGGDFSMVANVTEAAYTDEDVTPGEEYSYYIVALYEGGFESYPSETITQTAAYEAEFSIDPETYTFGEVGILDGEVFYPVDNAEFMVLNSGTGSFSVVTEPEFFSGQPDAFSYVGDASYPYEIEGPYELTGESLDFEVAFNPTQGGLFNTLLVVEDDMGRTVRTFEINGSAYEIPDYDIAENAYMIDQEWATNSDFNDARSFDDFYNDYRLVQNADGDVVYHFSVDKDSYLTLTNNSNVDDFAVFPESTTDFSEENNIYEDGETGISTGAYYVVVSGSGDYDFDMHVEGQEPVLAVEPDNLDLGDVPIGCWHEGGTFKVYNDGGQTITINNATLSDENGVYVLDHKYEFPVTISTDTLYFNVHLDAETPGVYDAAFLLTDDFTTYIHDITGEAYNAPEGDVFCNPFMVTFDGDGHYEQESTVGDPMRDNYHLVDGYGDVVYQFTYETDMIIDIAVDNLDMDPQMNLYKASDLAGVGGDPSQVDPFATATDSFTDLELWGGTYYLVLAGDPTVEDPTYMLTMDIEDMPVPGDITLVSPADGTEEVPIDTTLEWTLGDYTNNIDVYLDTQYPPEDKVLGNGDPVTSIDVTALSPAQVYFWKVVAHNDAGSTESDTWAFTTKLPPPLFVQGDIFDYVNVHLQWNNPYDATFRISEDFENGEMPDGWTNQTNGTGSTAGWFVTDDGGSSSFEIPAHTYYAVSNDDMTDDDSSEDYMIMPSEDFSEWATASLTFESFFDGSFGQTAYVEISTDGGDTFEVVHELEAADSWTAITVDLSEYAVEGNTDVHVAFHADDNGGWASGWAVDDVLLEFEAGEGKANRALTGYNVYQNGTKINDELVPEEEYDVMDLAAGEYTFGVSAVFDEGESEIIEIDPITILGMSEINGTVSDYDTGEGIEEVSITMTSMWMEEELEYTTTTDADGYYEVEVPVTEGGYDVTANSGEYVGQTEEDVMPPAGSSITVDFALGEFPIPVPEVLAVESEDETQAIVTWEEPSGYPSYEIIYDDGIATNATAWNAGYEGNMNALKFTPEGYPATIKKAMIHIWDGTWPAGDVFNPMEIVILDDDGSGGNPGTELGSIEVTPETALWNTIDVSSLGITIEEGDFYIANRQISVYPDCPPTAIAEGTPQNRSYAYSGGSWGTASYDCFMIRAEVAGPQGAQMLGHEQETVNVKNRVNEGSVSITPSDKAPGTYVEGQATVKQVAEAPARSRAVDHYEVWRFEREDLNDPSSWTLLDDDVTETEYTDDEWSDLEYGVYQYAVKAIYSITEADPTVSNELPKDMYTEVLAIVELNTGDEPSGVMVKLENVNEPEYVYEQTTDANGQASFDAVWKGEYLVTVAKEGYDPHFDNITLTETYFIYEVMLNEALAVPQNLEASVDCKDVMLSWEEGSAGNVEWTQDFEGLFPPEGWAKQQNAGEGWFQTSDGSSTYWDVPSHDSQYACSNDDMNNDDSSMDYLISPMQSFQGFTSGTLSFESFYDGAYSQEAYVELTTDGGDTWEVIHEVAESSSWETITIDLEEYLTSEYSQVWIGFHANDAGTWASGWAIDNVSLNLSIGGQENQNREFLGYNIYRNDMMLNSTPLTETSYTDENTPGGSFTYYVKSAYSTGESEPSDAVSVDVEIINPAQNLTTEKQSFNNILLEWAPPSDLPIYTLQYDNGENFTSIGTDGEFDFSVASRWYPENLEIYDGQYLTEISFYPAEEQCEYYARVWTGSDATLVVDQLIPADQITLNQWNTVELNTPVQIDADEEFWFGYRANAQAGYPAGADAGPAYAYHGDMIWDAENGWLSMAESYGLDYNWNLAGTVTGGEGEQGVLSALPENSQPVKRGTIGHGDINTNPEPLNLNDREFAGYKINRNDTYWENDTTLVENYQQTFFIDFDVPIEPGVGVDYMYYVVAQYDSGCEAEAVESIVSYGTDAPVDLAGQINIYPNPANDHVFFDVSDNIESYRIMNTVGQVISQNTVVGDDVINVNTESFEAGTYLVQFTTDSGKLVSKRFILVK